MKSPVPAIEISNLGIPFSTVNLIIYQILVTKSFGIMGLLLVVTMPIWPLILLRRGVLSYYVVPTLRILILQQLVSVRMINYHL